MKISLKSPDEPPQKHALPGKWALGGGESQKTNPKVPPEPPKNGTSGKMGVPGMGGVKISFCKSIFRVNREYCK
jgi:hypothetical protein